jgi:hypothetical protein
MSNPNRATPASTHLPVFQSLPHACCSDRANGDKNKENDPFCQINFSVSISAMLLNQSNTILKKQL